MATQREITSFFSIKTSVETAASEASQTVKFLLEELINETTSKDNVHSGSKVQEATEKAWKKSFPWLLIEQSGSESGPTAREKRLFCSICRSTGTQNVMGTEGSKNIQRSTIKFHNESEAERKLLKQKRKLHVVDHDNSDDDIHVDLDGSSGTNLEYNVSKTDKVVFNTVYYCAKEELPSDKINSLLQLQRLNGIETGYRDISWDTYTCIQKCLSTVLQQNMMGDVKTSKFFGLMIDESQDISVQKNLGFVVRYVSDGKPVTSFLKTVDINDGKAHTITNKVHETLHNLGLDMSYLVGLGTDGASVMTGKHTGVGVQLKTKYAPFVLQYHCVAHRLSLACTDALKKITQLETFRSRFNVLFYHFNSSGVRTAKLTQIQKIFDDPELKIKEPHQVRWLSLQKAVEAVYRCYPSIVSTLGEIAETNATAQSLYKYFVDSKTALLTAFMNDVHRQIALFSKQLQKENLVFSEVKPLFEATLASLKLLSKGGDSFKEMQNSLKEEDGHLKGVQLTGYKEERPDILSLMGKYVESLCDNITSRLKDSNSTLLQDFGTVLEPSTFSEELADIAIDNLANFYGVSKTTSVIDDTDVTTETQIPALLDKEKLIETEWPMLKAMIMGSYKLLSTKAMCSKIINNHSELMPNACVLSRIALCLCISSVECERSFSTQNRLKSRYRSSLKSESLDVLMRISMIGPSVDEYDVTNAVKLWHQKQRRINRLFKPYQKRTVKKQKC